MIASVLPSYITSEKFREGILSLLKQSTGALPSDITRYLTSEEVSTPAIPTRAHVDKAEVLKRILAMKAEGLSLQAIADRLTAEGVPTLSGKGRWQKGTIGNLLAQVEER
jgi:hypothetical protein